jgi:deoxyadenosine/deoxycytidine kinase
MVKIYSVDGNIGAGKTTFLEAVRASLASTVHVVLEPVGEWMRLKNAEGVSLLELFYSDKKRWAYTFQNCAILTRLRAIQEAIKGLPDDAVILTERSVLTDRFVFAEMLRASGDIDALEWELYCKWFDTFAAAVPVTGIIYLTTGVGTSAGRIVTRGRSGEDHIPLDYLSALDTAHRAWIDSTELPVLRVSTEPGSSLLDAVAAVQKFIVE